MLKRAGSTAYSEATTTITDIKPRIVHIILIELVQDILSVVLYQLHHFDHADPFTLDQGIARLIAAHVSLTAKST